MPCFQRYKGNDGDKGQAEGREGNGASREGRLGCRVASGVVGVRHSNVVSEGIKRATALLPGLEEPLLLCCTCPPHCQARCILLRSHQQCCLDACPHLLCLQAKLSQRFPGIAFTVCPKADALYPIVSAASIVAKVTRDHLLRDFAHPESVAIGTKYGSGYPG